MKSESRSALEAANPTTPAAAPSARRRRRRLVRSAVIALVAAVVLIPAALLIATLIADASLSDSVKALPPALREHLQIADAKESNPSPPVAANPEPLSAAAGLVYDAGFNSEFQAAFYTVAGVLPDGSQNIFKKKPPDASTAAFLQKYRGLLDRFYAWIDSGGSLSSSASNDDINAYNWLTRMALADAELDWQSGNTAKAVRIAQALLKLGDVEALPMLKHWMEAKPLAGDQASALLHSMDLWAQKQVAVLSDSEIYWKQYASSREVAVQMLDQPWYSPVYGFQPQNARTLFKIAGVRVPDPIRLADKAIMAIRLKRRAPEILATWDDWNQQQILVALRNSPMAFDPHQRRGQEPEDAISAGILPRMSAVSMRRAQLNWLLYCNLLRAGLTVLSDPEARPASAEAIKADPANPWRDPFSYGALQMLERDGRRAIFSRGPIGGPVNVHEIFDGGNENVLLLPKAD